MCRFFSSCGELGYTLVVCRFLIVVDSLVAEHRLKGEGASGVVACGLSSCGFGALEHRLNSCGTWA